MISNAYVVVTVLAAAAMVFSAAAGFVHARWVVRAMTGYGVPRPWWPWLSAAKVAGAAGLLVGLVVPVIGVLAGICLVLYFAGAVVTVVRARFYWHLPAPLLFVAPVVGSLALGLAS